MSSTRLLILHKTWKIIKDMVNQSKVGESTSTFDHMNTQIDSLAYFGWSCISLIGTNHLVLLPHLLFIIELVGIYSPNIIVQLLRPNSQ